VRSPGCRSVCNTSSLQGVDGSTANGSGPIGVFGLYGKALWCDQPQNRRHRNTERMQPGTPRQEPSGTSDGRPWRTEASPGSASAGTRERASRFHGGSNTFGVHVLARLGVRSWRGKMAGEGSWDRGIVGSRDRGIAGSRAAVERRGSGGKGQRREGAAEGRGKAGIRVRGDDVAPPLCESSLFEVPLLQRPCGEVILRRRKSDR
jgi:hypothetical protein